jgi:hypothetical protein
VRASSRSAASRAPAFGVLDLLAKPGDPTWHVAQLGELCKRRAAEDKLAPARIGDGLAEEANVLRLLGADWNPTLCRFHPETRLR